jgi:hypothetical protein
MDGKSDKLAAQLLTGESQEVHHLMLQEENKNY